MIKRKNKLTEGTATGFQIAIIIVLAIFAFCQIFPFYIQIIRAFQPKELIPVPGKVYWLPISWNFGNFAESFKRVELLQGVLNSLIVGIGFTLLSSAVILIAGYTLGKKKFRGKRVIIFCMLMTMAVPGEMLLVTNYLLISQLNWTNNFAGLILPGIVNIMGTFLVMSFMNTIPDAVLESADLDGAREIRKIFAIILPLCMPVIATYWIITFVAKWNDYLWPMIITNDRSMFTVQLKLMEFNPYYMGFADEVLKAAAHIMSLIPVIILYVLCQKRFVGGISVSGLK